MLLEIIKDLLSQPVASYPPAAQRKLAELDLIQREVVAQLEPDGRKPQVKRTSFWEKL
jgi:hypothetical protein